MHIRTLFRSLRSFLHILVGSAFLLSFSPVKAFAQGDPAAGVQLFSTNNFGVDLATGNISVMIPLRSKSTLSIALIGNFHPYLDPNGVWVVNTGFKATGSSLLGYGVFWNYSRPYPPGCHGMGDSIDYGFYVQDMTGAQHPLSLTFQMDAGGCVPPPASGLTTDGSGLTVVTGGSFNTSSWKIYDSGGNHNTFSSIITPDGVVLNSFASGAYQDSLTSTAVLTVATHTGQTADTYSYYDASNTQQTITASKTGYYLWTAFGCFGDYHRSSLSYLPTTVTTPTGAYSITYEQTPGQSSSYVTGRIASLTYPSGGSVSYTYSGANNGLNCANGSAPLLTITVNDGKGNNSQYTYADSGPQGAYSSSALVKTDPAGNQTTYTFGGEFQTQAVAYQGGCPTSITSCNGGGTLLSTTTTCYNGVFTGCGTSSYGPTPPITLTDVYTSFNASSSNLVETKFDSYGNTFEVKKYTYGAAMPPTGNPVSDTVISYGQSWNGTTCTAYPSGTYIFNTPCYRHTMNSLGTDVAKTQIGYSSTGHPTSTTKWASGSSWVSSTASYDSNGRLAWTKDAALNQTSFYYNGPNGCNNLLLTSTVSPAALTTSQTWDCNGGVVTSTTDANGKVTINNFDVNGVGDPLYRPLSIIDPLNNTTSFGYTPTTTESAMNFNGPTSTTDALATTDGIGRTIFAQKRQGQGSSTPFDSTQTAYGWNSTGAFTKQSMPYSGTAGQSAPTGTPVTTTQYDALGRAISVTDGGGGTTSYVYSKNDVLITTGPTQNFKKQFEYDGLGRLTSVCEVTAGTTAWPGGNCAQTNPLTGYWTQYTYDALGNLQTVSQNAQGTPQTRNYIYDGLSRLVSESNPETGGIAITYTFDTDGTCGTSNGDLVKKVDAANNVSCYAYDTSHRVKGITYPSGPYAASTPSKTFVYDATTFSCTNPTNPNVKGRLAEAFTGPSTAKVTDIAYCYSARGETTDVFESTLNSNGTYHTTASYWANGALNVLSGVPSRNAWTFGVDGEGRPYSTVDGSTTNLVTSTTYYPTAANTTVNLGSGDSDTYTYDPNTGRMATYQYKVGATPKYVTGTLGWNQNGTLGSLLIADGFDSANAQNCGYTYDDVARLQSVSCGPTNRDGTTWGQTFAYDPFGNISKSGTSSFLPTYTGTGTTPTNQFYQLPGGPTGTSHYYDLNGNLTSDLTNMYAWDADGNTVGFNLGGSAPINITYDAFDRIVEENHSGTYKQILYSPIGKLALMTRQITNNVFLPLPGGEQATYTGNTIRFRHYDWLGSARFESNMAEAEYGDVAYAPFGETYSIKNTPYLSFTGQQQDTVSGTYDFLYREYNPVQGRWISPDPAGLAAVNPTNPQSWNRYAYVGDSPLSAVDPLGQWFEWVQGFDSNGRECRLDGFVTPCAMVQSALQADIAVNCPQCLPGQSVGADNLIYGYTPSTSEEYWTSPDDMYHFALTMGGWGVVGSVAANNFGGYDWGVFWNGVLHGVRQPGQSFSDCVNQNVSDTTFGAVDPGKLFSNGMAKAEGTAMALSIPSIPTPWGPIAAGPYATRLIASGLGAGAFLRGAATTVVRGGLQAVAVAGAATLGLGIGSSVNCR
jgi:RHS repeat-associated protein